MKLSRSNPSEALNIENVEAAASPLLSRSSLRLSWEAHCFWFHSPATEQEALRLCLSKGSK